VDEVIRPALARGADVVCDRYVDSSLAYQGLARGLGLEPVLALNLAAVGGLLPDRTVLLLLPPDEAAARLDGELDRIEREGDDFAARVDKGYREIAHRFHGRFLCVDATQESDSLARAIRAELRRDS